MLESLRLVNRINWYNSDSRVNRTSTRRQNCVIFRKKWNLKSVSNCVCVVLTRAPVVTVYDVFFQFFILSYLLYSIIFPSYSTYSPNFALASPLWKPARST